MNPNTVVRAYRELEHEGVLELKHGSGAFIKATPGGRARLVHEAQRVMHSTVERLISRGISKEELRRVFENELAQAGAEKPLEGEAVAKP